MLIDWFTVGAEALNFLLLVWLLRRFLYKPILKAIDAREERIAAELADARTKQAEARRERDEFQQKNVEFDQERHTLMMHAVKDAKAERQLLVNDAKLAADALRVKRLETLRHEVRTLNVAISQRTQQEVFEIARKVLTDLSSTSLEERSVEVFVRHLRAIDDQTRVDISKSLTSAFNLALVRSAFDLPVEQRAAIQSTLNDIAASEISIRFETAPDLVCGIELTTNGQKVAWSIADYLGSLEEGVNELLQENDSTDANGEAGHKIADHDADI